MRTKRVLDAGRVAVVMALFLALEITLLTFT